MPQEHDPEPSESSIALDMLQSVASPTESERVFGHGLYNYCLCQYSVIVPHCAKKKKKSFCNSASATRSLRRF